MGCGPGCPGCRLSASACSFGKVSGLQSSEGWDNGGWAELRGNVGVQLTGFSESTSVEGKEEIREGRVPFPGQQTREPAPAPRGWDRAPKQLRVGRKLKCVWQMDGVGGHGPRVHQPGENGLERWAGSFGPPVLSLAHEDGGDGRAAPGGGEAGAEASTLGSCEPPSRRSRQDEPWTGRRRPGQTQLHERGLSLASSEMRDVVLT